MASNYINNTKKLLEKIKTISPDNEYLYTQLDDSSGGPLINGRMCGLAIETGDVSVYLSLCRLDPASDDLYYRFYYKISLQSTGKIKNLDSMMSVITSFEHEFIYADKINVIQDSGVAFIDIFKKKQE